MDGSRSSRGRLFVLDLSASRVLSLNPDGSDPRTVVTGCRLPDSLVVDAATGCIYWTSMGIPHRNDGSSSARIWTVPIVDSSFPKEARSRQSNFISKRGPASSIGRTAKACA